MKVRSYMLSRFRQLIKEKKIVSVKPHGKTHHDVEFEGKHVLRLNGAEFKDLSPAVSSDESF